MKKFLFSIGLWGLAAFASGQPNAPGSGTVLHAFRNFQGDKPGSYVAGPVTFNSQTPSVVNLISDQTSLGRIYAGEYVNYKWYAMITKPGTQSGVEGLATIDVATGERKIIATSSKSKHLTDMTYDYTTETMFGIASSAEQLAKIDLKSCEVELVNAFKDAKSNELYALALACDLNGQLYMISTEDTLYRVDKENAACSPVGYLEADASFTQTMAFDHHTHTLYWINNADYTLYTVDLFTGRATSQGRIGAKGMDSMGSLFIPFINVAKGAPDRVLNRKTESFADKIVISWNYPSSDAQGNPLTELTKAYLYRDNELIESLTLTPANAGQAATFTDSGIGNGKHFYRIICENSKGKGGVDDDDIPGFSGDNAPGAVCNFTVQPGDNVAILSWNVPLKGAYGGVYRPEDLKGYIIYRISDSGREEIKINDPAATGYTDAAGFGKYAYALTAFNSVGAGIETTSPAIQVKPADWYVMCNGEFTVTEGTFYDSGGPDGYYKNAENLIMTLKPALANSVLVAEFTEFSIDNYGDTLYIYDGINTSARLIGKYSSLSLPADLKSIMATNPDGALTFRFYSDVAFPDKGWKANLSCLQKKEYDLAASRIEGNLFPSQNQETSYSITLVNLGINQVNGRDYKIQLTDENNRMIAQANGADINSMETKTVTVKYTPQTSGTIRVKGRVDYQNDNDPGNNSTDSITLTVQAEGSQYVSIGNNTPALGVLPASFYQEESLGETLYRASQINLPDGMLQMISYPVKAEMSYDQVNLKVWITETDLDNLKDGNIFAREMTKVFEGICPIQNGDKEWDIVFFTPFEYTGKNLVVLIQKGGSKTANMGITFCGTYGNPEEMPVSQFISSESMLDPNAGMGEYAYSTMQPDIRMLFTRRTGISNSHASQRITAYPNPFTEFIRIDSNVRVSNIVITNLAGEKVLQNTTNTVQTSSLDKGVYILSVFTEEGETFQQKIIKK